MHRSQKVLRFSMIRQRLGGSSHEWGGLPVLAMAGDPVSVAGDGKPSASSG